MTYRALFIVFDILLPIVGIALNTFSPKFPVSGYTLDPQEPLALEILILLDCTSGWFAALAFISTFFLFYRPNDLLIWKGLIGAIFLQDLFMLGGFARELKLRGSQWTGDDYGNIIGYSAIALVRALFVVGVGLDGQLSSEANEPKLK